LDLDRNIRPQVGITLASGGTADMGAYEGAEFIKSIASGNWHIASTWNYNRIPGNTDKVIIDTNHTVTVSTPDNTSQANSVEFRSGARILYLALGGCGWGCRFVILIVCRLCHCERSKAICWITGMGLQTPFHQSIRLPRYARNDKARRQRTSNTLSSIHQIGLQNSDSCLAMTECNPFLRELLGLVVTPSTDTDSLF
jgi:hypothetical protein